MATAPRPRRTTKAKPGHDKTIHSPEVETLLAQLGIATFWTKRIKIADIHKARSHREQVRDEVIKEDAVLRYAIRMLDGEMPPPIVIRRMPNGFLILLDGIQRTAAAEEAGVDALDAYIVDDVTDGQADAYRYAAQTLHGEPTTADERLRHAAHLVEAYGWSQTEAAALLKIPSSRVAAEIAQRRGRERLLSMDPRYGKFPDTVIGRLNAIQHDEVLEPAARLIAETRPGYTEIRNFIVELNKGRSVAAQHKTIARYNDDWQDRKALTAGGTTKATPMQATVRAITHACTKLRRVTPLNVADLEGAYPDDARERLRKALIETSDHALELARSMRR